MIVSRGLEARRADGFRVLFIYHLRLIAEPVQTVIALLGNKGSGLTHAITLHTCIT